MAEQGWEFHAERVTSADSTLTTDLVNLRNRLRQWRWRIVVVRFCGHFMSVDGSILRARMAQAMTNLYLVLRPFVPGARLFPLRRCSSIQFLTGFLQIALASLWFTSHSASAALVDARRANDLNALDNGDAVGAWNSASNRVGSAVVGSQPTLLRTRRSPEIPPCSSTPVN